MCRRVLPAMLVAGAALALPVQAQSWWEFSYAGFLDAESQRFDSSLLLDGMFLGSDKDGDGSIGIAELSGFILDRHDFFMNPDGGCYGARCDLKRFNYELATGRLFFEAEWGYSDEANVVSTRTVTGLSHSVYSETGFRPPFVTHTTTWLWTDQTQFAVSAIDEPPMLAMLPLGLLLLQRLTRRKKDWHGG